MAPKIIAFLITLIINAAAGLVVFLMMLMGMNGFSESDANYGLITYIVLSILVSLLMATLAAVSVHLLSKREFRSVVSVLLSVLVFSVVGSVLKVVCSIIGVLIADFVRVNY